MQTQTIPIHVIHVPTATARWERWRPLVAAGLAVEEPAVTPAELDLERLVRQGSLGPLAGWRIAKGVPPVDYCVLTALVQMACLYSHARLIQEQVRRRAAVFAIAEDDAVPTEAAARALPVIAAAADRLDPGWDLICMASWETRSHPSGATASVAVPGVPGGTVTLRRLRYTVGAGFQLLSLRGAEKLLPMLAHTDTHVDKVYGFAAHLDLLRVYAAETDGPLGLGWLFGREPFVPLGPESRASQLGHRTDPRDAVADPVVSGLLPPTPPTAGVVVALAVACCVVAVLLGAVLAAVCVSHNTRKRRP